MPTAQPVAWGDQHISSEFRFAGPNTMVAPMSGSGVEGATERLHAWLRGHHADLQRDGKLANAEIVKKTLDRFRVRFGPDALSRLDGEALLNAMHGRKSKDSLAYWLEFKDDADFPVQFGSIAGGSALKFGIYQSAENHEWMAGNPRQQTRLELQQAIDTTRQQRSELLAGVRVLEQFSAQGGYPTLQKQMMAAAPTIGASAWAHKYFYLLFSSILAPLHSVDYQCLQLYRLLEVPGNGHYENDGIFVRLAHTLGFTPLELMEVLTKPDGSLPTWWRIGTKIDEHPLCQRE